jgi:Domain of unknown function (DUF4388)
LADDAFPISGSIDPKAFPFLLMDLHRQGATGSLKVDGPTYQKAIYFRGGRVLFGSSNDPKDQLGAILIESGRINPEQLEDVNAKVGPGSPLAKVLAESGFVSQRELSEAARAKVERILADVLSYDSGSFDFEDGVLPKGAVDLKLATDKLVLSATRRISERPFALRHLDSLEAVLTLTPGAQERLAEVLTETGRLGDFLDGTRSLKEAAAAARLDEFDAAKIACGLLFLGLATLGRAAAPEHSAEASGFAIIEGDELDLGSTARMALGGPAPASTVIVEPEPEPALDPSAFAPPMAPESAPPEAPPRPRPQRTLEPETMYIEPSQPEDATITPHAAAGTLPLSPPPKPSASDTKPPVPGRSVHPQPLGGGFEGMAPPESAPKSRPPSREDLAALDALLNSSSHEGPLTPLEKHTEARWEPRASATPRPQGRRGRSSGNRALPAFAVLVLLIVLGAGGWYWYQFVREAPARVASGPISTPVTASTLAATPPTTMVDPTSLPSAAGGVAETVPGPTGSPSAPVTTVPPTTLPPASPTGPAGGRGPVSLAEARSALERGDFSRAARGFEAQLRDAGRGAYSVQLLVACSEETVAKAARNVADKELFILAAEYKGRSCYRVCWGVYESEPVARSAVASVPGYFRKGGAAPKPVAAASILP